MEPCREVGEVAAIGATGRLGETGAREEPVDRSGRIHGYGVLSRPNRSPLRIVLLLLLVVVTIGAIVGATRSSRGQESREPASGPDALMLVGDSLNVGIEPYLREALPDSRIAAFDLVGRGTQDGIDELRRLRGTLAPVVVVSLGTNDAEGTESRFRALVDEALELAGDETCVVWATIVRDGTPRTGFNDVLLGAQGRHPNLRLVDWAGLVEDDPEMLASDLVHGTPAGYARRAGETARVASACTRA